MMRQVIPLLLSALLCAQSQAGQIYSELTLAIQTEDHEAVYQLLQQDKAQVHQLERDGSHPLLWAVYQEDMALTNALLQAGAPVNQADREGFSPLLMAAKLGNAELIERLVKAGADLDTALPRGETALMLASRSGHVDAVSYLLDQGVEIDQQESLRQTTALMWAAAYRQPETVALLLARGADPHLRSASTSPGRRPYLAPSARERIREFYEGSGLVGDSVGADDDEALAAQREELLARLPPMLKEQFAEEQRQAAQDSQQQNAQWGGLSALHFAAREGDLDSIRHLVDSGADVNQRSEFGWTPLLTATQNRYYSLAAYLLEQGADPNISNDGGWNPLYIATDNRNIEGGDYPTRKPGMPHLDYIRLLLEYGADPNLRMRSSTETRTIFTHQWVNEDGATPFLRAAQSSDLELMHLLLAHGADPNIPTRDGVTPLMLAAGIGWVEGVTYEWSEAANAETLDLLIALGNDVNAQDTEDYRTALMGAAMKGRNYAVEILVNAGADLAIRDIGSRDSIHNLSGATWQALDYAEGLVRIGVQSAEAHPNTVALLRSLMVERGLEVPPEGRTLDSVCIVALCQ